MAWQCNESCTQGASHACADASRVYGALSLRSAIATPLVRAGRAQPSMLSTISVEYYGAATPLQNLASVSAPDAQTLMIKPFDKSGIKV